MKIIYKQFTDWVINGERVKKLFYKTQQIYLSYAVISFMVIAPLFYFITKSLYINEIDETLLLRKQDFIQASIPKLKEQDISVWNNLNYDLKITNATTLNADTLFTTLYFSEIEQENESYRVLNSPIIIDGKPYTFTSKISLFEAEDLIISLAIFFIILILLLFLGLFFFTKRFSQRIWTPFYDTLNKTEDFELDKKMQPHFLKTNIVEFRRLNLSIEKLIKANLIIYENQREFLENAAHELQTPIAVFQAKIDTLIQRSDITQGQSEILDSLNGSVSRLNRLNKNLLLISKIDNKQLNKTTLFSIKEIIEKLLDFFTEQAEQKDITIKTNFQNDITINANIGLTEILVSNLFLNAIRHNVKSGELNVSFSEQKLVITNTGRGEELTQEKLFNRFSKSHSSEQGNGLGLAIVKKIADFHQWKVSYTFFHNIHSFSVQF